MKTMTNRAVKVAGVLLGALLLLSVAFGQDEDLTAGERLFRETAGGVGCAYCHGLDGRGNGTAGVNAPDILGAQMPAIRSSLAGAVPMMGFIQLNERELQAVAAYLRQLSAPPADDPPTEEPPTEESSAQVSARFYTVNVEITETGFGPASITIPVGETVQLVVRNRTQDEHHYRIVGLVPRNLLWIADPEPEEPIEGVTDEEHDAHHKTSFVAWRAPSPSGIQPNGEEVHAWMHPMSPGGNKDVVLFQATEVGTFQVVCPLHPDFLGEVTVY